VIAIRDARASDAEAVASLSRELGYEVTEEEARRRLPSAVVLVAEEDGVVVGWCQVAPVPSVVHDPFVEIRGLVVTQSRRSSGIGRALLDRVEEWTREQGMTHIRVHSNVVRDRARKFYEKNGYAVTKTSNVFDKELSS
jgi:GNAT superfamily N-acetyltransferase